MEENSIIDDITSFTSSNIEISEVQSNSLTEEHNVFRNDPIYFKSLIGKKIEVELFNDTKHIGILYCIDPVSETIILVNTSGDKYDTDIILGHTVKNINLVCDQVSDNIIFHKSIEQPKENCEDRKQKVRSWLSLNLIEVSDDGDSLSVSDDLTITPPYTIDSCLSSNTIILERIQNLLSKMP